MSFCIWLFITDITRDPLFCGARTLQLQALKVNTSVKVNVLKELLPPSTKRLVDGAEQREEPSTNARIRAL
jgi:hypothetical protein